MSRHKYTTMDRVFAKIDRDLSSDFNEDDIIEWTGEALEGMSCAKSYEEDISFVEVKNHQCAIPKWCHSIIQIAKYDGNDIPNCFEAAKTTIKETCDSTFDFAVIDCGGQLTLLPDFNFKLDYSGLKSSSYYKTKYTPVFLSENSLFNALVCTEDNTTLNCPRLYEYKIVMGDTLRFNFKDGIVAIPFLRQVVDENGYPMIPDSYSHLQAIVSYIGLRMAMKDLNNGREGSQARVAKYEQDWQWYCKQAGNQDMMPNGVDEHQNLLNQRSYLLPRDSYFGFFGNLARKENRIYNNPRGFRRYYNG